VLGVLANQTGAGACPGRCNFATITAEPADLSANMASGNNRTVSMALELRPLGRSQLKLSQLGLGTVKLGRNTDVKYPAGFELPSDEAVVELLSEASRLGINVLDTAPAYGHSEARLGDLLPRVSGQFQIITKVGETYDPTTGSHYDFSERAIQESLETSLKRLNRDQLDVVLLHSNGQDTEILEAGALDNLLKARDQGLIRAVGLSGKTVEGGQLALELGADCLMITLNANEQHERPLIEAAAAYLRVS
jgi:Predicted oxidoreductases (related to aryl-alcohol dehydrogenases)